MVYRCLFHRAGEAHGAVFLANIFFFIDLILKSQLLNMNLKNLLQIYSWVVMSVVFVRGSWFRDAIARHRAEVVTDVLETTEGNASGNGTLVGLSTIPWDIMRSSRTRGRTEVSMVSGEVKLCTFQIVQHL